MGALTRNDAFAGELAELALVSHTIQDFRCESLMLARRRFSVDFASMFVTSDGAQFECSDSDNAPSDLPARLPHYFREFSHREWSTALRRRTQSCDEIIAPSRRDQLALYREYLAERRVRAYALRMWIDGGTLYGFVLNRTSTKGWCQLMHAARQGINAAYPILALTEKLHRIQSQAGHASTLSQDRSASYRLSRSEQAALALLVRGLTNAEIATILRVSKNTVRNQIVSIYRKLGVSRRAEAVYVLTQPDGSHDNRRRNPSQWFVRLRSAEQGSATDVHG